MDTVFVLGIALAALFVVLIVIRAYSGIYKKQAPAEYTGTGATETASTRSFGKKDLGERTIPETGNIPGEPAAQTNPRELYSTKASLLLKLLANVKKTEGIREVSLAEVNSLSGQIEDIKKGLEGTETKYDLRESEVRMSYASSRIEWLIKSYPRLRNDVETSALTSEIRKIDHKINNSEEV